MASVPMSRRTPLALGFVALVLCAAPALGQADPAQTDDENLIREARARSNAAIAAHDLEGILAEIDDDFQATAGSGLLVHDRTEMREAFAAQFAAFDDVRYVRTPEYIEVGEGGVRAFESGVWVGTWTAPEGAVRTGGRYSAQWSTAPGSWKIRAEVFVTLFCEGAGCS